MTTRGRSMLLLLVMPLLQFGCVEPHDPLAPRESPEEPAQLRIPADGFVQVATGALHTCALQSDGTMGCWGGDTHGQTDVPAGLAGLTQVSTGRFHTCALRSEGTVVCWGNSASLPVPDGLSDVTQVSAGGNHTCALGNDGTVICWGSNPAGETDVPAGLTEVTQVSAGGHHVCALRSAGNVVCWGDPHWGATNPPDGLAGVTQVSAGDLHTCALRSDGTVICWGDDRDGAATPPADLAGVTQLSTGRHRGCVLTSDGTVVCWGVNPDVPASFTEVTQLGQGAASPGVCALRLDSTIVCHTMPGPPALRIHPVATFSASPASVVAGESFTLALEDAQVPGHPEATAFTYAFDCGDGSGFGPFTAGATAVCPTTVIGIRTVRGRVRDHDGDEGEYTAELEVTPFFAFNGFLPPIREGVLNRVKAGQAVPVRFGLGGDHGLQIFASGHPGSQQIACELADGTSTITETSTAGGSRLSYDAQTDTYTYVWKTEKEWSASCRRLMLQLADGQIWTADFEFTR